MFAHTKNATVCAHIFLWKWSFAQLCVLFADNKGIAASTLKFSFAEHNLQESDHGKKKAKKRWGNRLTTLKFSMVSICFPDSDHGKRRTKENIIEIQEDGDEDFV